MDGQDGDYSGDRSNSIYENVITNHGNIIATFYATQQVKVMLGELADAMADEEDEDDRRRRLSDCVSTAHGYSSTDCSAVSCEDPTRMCDGSFNFPYVASLEGGEYVTELLLSYWTAVSPSQFALHFSWL